MASTEGALGLKAPFNKPQLCIFCSHSQSLGSDFLSRPGTCARCRVSASSTAKPCPSSNSCGAIQYTPVLSIATDSTFRSLSQAARRSNSAVVPPKGATSRPVPSSAGAHAQCCSLPKSIPATLARSAGSPATLSRFDRGVGSPFFLLVFIHSQPFRTRVPRLANTGVLA